jgi:predicted aspartyl protease
MLPLTLAGAQTIAVSALLDTGAALNVLPYAVGVRLGFEWDRQTTTVRLTGNMASVEARVVIVDATVARFPAVRLAFAWAKQDDMPVLLGQVNFFMEFDVCFLRSRAVFEVRPAS